MTKWVETLCLKVDLRFTDFKRRKYGFSSPIPSQCCAYVRATLESNKHPNLERRGHGRGADSFVFQSYPVNNFVADCRNKFYWRNLGPNLKFDSCYLLLFEIIEGDIGSTQCHNTVRKICKYRNTVLKIDEILILHLWSVMHLSCIHLACLFISSMYTPKINLSHCEEMSEDLE